MGASALRFARKARDGFPPTLLGLVVAAASALALFHYGLARIDLVLLVAGAVGLATCVLTTLLVGGTAFALWWKQRHAAEGMPLRLETSRPVPTGFSIPTLWWVPFVRVTWAWSEPGGFVRTHKARGRLWEEALPARRGIREGIVRTFDVRDVFGLARVTFTAAEKRPIKVAPTAGALRQMHVVRSMAGGSDIAHHDGPPEGERMDMRNYSAGDPIRYVLWKVFARSRELVIRTPERALSPIRQTVAYLVTGDGDEPAAGAAKVAVDCGALGSDWVLGADGTGEYAKAASAALDVLARSGDTSAADGGVGLEKFLRSATPASTGRAVVFVPPRPGPWLTRAAAAARARATGGGFSSVEFVVCTDGVARDTDTPRWRRWLERKAERNETTMTPASASELAKVVEALSAARARVLIVDRVQGRVYTEGLTKLAGYKS